MKVKSLSRVLLFETPWTAAYQAPPSMGFSQARVLEWEMQFSHGQILKKTKFFFFSCSATLGQKVKKNK